jgi:hypothetical protein
MATKNNWFTTNLSQRSIDNLCDFEMTITPYEFQSVNFHEQSVKVAKELADTHDKLFVSYSGGIDSEYVLKTFHESGLPITPVIIDTPYSIEESSYAFKFCRENGISPEVLTFSENDIVDRLQEKSTSRGLFSLLGGLPLIAADAVNQVGGKLITGHGDPFTIIAGIPRSIPMSETLEMSEWDYYLDSYDNTHPSGFFTYDLSLFYSMIEQIRYDCSVQRAKYEFYKVEPRMKMFWKKEFYQIFRELKPAVKQYNAYIEKNELFKLLNEYKS